MAVKSCKWLYKAVTERSTMSSLMTKTIETSSTRLSGYKLPWNRGAVESTSPGCWMNQEQNFNCHHPTQLNPKLCRPYFPKINHKPKPQTVRHFYSAPTQPNSTKFSMQPYFNPTRRFMSKKWSPPQKKI